MAENSKKPAKETKLKSALRENLKKRKAQARKLRGGTEENEDGVRLRGKGLSQSK